MSYRYWTSGLHAMEGRVCYIIIQGDPLTIGEQVEDDERVKW